MGQYIDSPEGWVKICGISYAGLSSCFIDQVTQVIIIKTSLYYHIMQRFFLWKKGGGYFFRKIRGRIMESREGRQRRVPPFVKFVEFCPDSEKCNTL